MASFGKKITTYLQDNFVLFAWVMDLISPRQKKVNTPMAGQASEVIYDSEILDIDPTLYDEDILGTDDLLFEDDDVFKENNEFDSGLDMNEMDELMDL